MITKSFYQAFGLTLGVAVGALAVGAVSGGCLAVYTIGVNLWNRPRRGDYAA